VNAEVDTEKRLEALEKANTHLETANFNLQARVVQLENELKAQEMLLAKQDQHWLARMGQVQREADDAVEVAKLSASKPDIPVDWVQCELLVDKLLRVGKLPRDKLSIRSRDTVFAAASRVESDEAVARGLQLMEGATNEIRDLGLEVALGCLAVMRENSLAALNTVTELQEASSKQQAVLDHLEKRLQDQRLESDQLRAQSQRAAWPNGAGMMRTESSSSSVQQFDEADIVTTIPRSKSHSSASGVLVSASGNRRQHLPRPNSMSRASSAVDDDSRRSRAMGTESDSEFDDDSEANSDSVGSRVRSSSSSTQRHRSLSHATVKFESDFDHDSVSRRGLKKQDGSRRPVLASGAESSTASPSAMMKVLQPQGISLGSNERIGSDMIRKRMELLQSGSLFVKYGRFGKPHVRFVWCSADLEHLHYRTVRSSIPKASISTRTISRVLVGQTTRVFDRAKQDARAPFCFSIEYEDARTLDLEVADGGELHELKMAKRGEWVEALQLLVKLKHAATISALTANAIQTRNSVGIVTEFPPSESSVGTPSTMPEELSGR
jgi:hypothetical protein